MKKYRTMLIDLDGTLFDFGATEKIALKELFDHLGIKWDEENRKIYHEKNTQCWRDYESGLITMPQLKIRRIRDFYEALGIESDVEKDAELYIEFLSRHGIPIPGALETLERLKKNFRIILITNGITKIQRGRLSCIEADRYFDDVVISEVIGVQKPQKEYFDYVMTRIDCKKDECLVIGDGLTSDIKGGREYGLDTFYLHLGKPNMAQEGEYTYEADSYEKLLSMLCV